MNKRFWILIAGIIPGLSLSNVLILVMLPISEAAHIPTVSALADNAATNQGCNYQTNVLADNPIAYWRLDETSGLTAA